MDGGWTKTNSEVFAVVVVVVVVVVVSPPKIIWFAFI